ncbi:MAG: N-acetylmuramoyl-L-alanine amidase family protein [Granulicatella sp.]|nr:MAG: N-acetylmuramoyl-L-alanine amidase family protein [Granulicatella sp.]
MMSKMKFLLGAMALSTFVATNNVQAAENEGIIPKCVVQENALVKGDAHVPVSKCGQPFRYSTPEWKVEKDGSKVLYRDGKRALKWQAVDNTWVFIGDNFKPLKGWQVLPVVQQGLINVVEGDDIHTSVPDKGYFYFNEQGYLQEKWVFDDGHWYYIPERGVVSKGWVEVKDKWYYFDTSGRMQTGWKMLNGVWYYLNESGAMETGWVQVDGKWYYFNTSGSMQTGWVQWNDAWYYFAPSGEMKTGWVESSGKWYFLKDSGKMAVSEKTSDGYQVDATGAWVR